MKLKLYVLCSNEIVTVRAPTINIKEQCPGKLVVHTPVLADTLRIQFPWLFCGWHAIHECTTRCTWVDSTWLPARHRTPPWTTRLWPQPTRLSATQWHSPCHEQYTWHSVTNRHWQSNNLDMACLMSTSLVGLSLTLYWVVKRTSDQTTQTGPPTAAVSIVKPEPWEVPHYVFGTQSNINCDPEGEI